MAISVAPAPQPLAPAAPPKPGGAVLVSGCDGYPAGTTGRIVGERQGCLVFAPHDPSKVARWAQPRPSILVPAALLVVAG